jgi:membrane protein YqaA with SNARE-associated domain
LFKAVEIIFFSVFLFRQTAQEWVSQIIDAANGFINNPLFAEYGRIGLFINGVFSTFIPFPPEVTAISLVFAGISRIEILIILVIGWVIGAALGYYAGFYGKKIVTIFKDRSKETKRSEEEEGEADTLNNKQSLQYKNNIHDNGTNGTYNDLLDKNKDDGRHSRHRQLLERYGWAIIFVSPWIPVLGDIIPLIAGAKRYDFKKFMVAIAAGKIARAVAMIFLGSYLASISPPPWI